MTITQVVIIATFTIWIVYTATAQKFGQRTISATLRDMGWDFNFFPFVWGMLIAHWFAPKREIMHMGLWGWGIGLPLILILLGVDIYWLLSKRERTLYRWPFWYFVAGLPIGYFFWSQASIQAPF